MCDRGIAVEGRHVISSADAGSGRQVQRVVKCEMDEDAFFAGRPEAKPIHEAVKRAALSAGPAEIRVTKSQIGFRRKRLFAATWRPDQPLKGDLPPLVLSVFLRHRESSPRWKEITEPRPGRFTHHIELRSPDEVDEEVRGWLAEAWNKAG